MPLIVSMRIGIGVDGESLKHVNSRLFPKSYVLNGIEIKFLRYIKIGSLKVETTSIKERQKDFEITYY